MRRLAEPIAPGGGLTGWRADLAGQVLLSYLNKPYQARVRSGEAQRRPPARADHVSKVNPWP